MGITIEFDAKSLSKQLTDLDYYRRTYSLIENSTDEEILVKFIAPKIIAFEDYRFYLMKESVTKQLDASRYYRPDYVSYDEYGITSLWTLLLFINDIPTIEDFDKEEILIPSRTSISNISRDIITKSPSTELVQLSDIPEKDTPPLFYKSQATPNYFIEPVSTPVFQPNDLYFYRETFTVTNIISQNRYIDLEFTAIEDSIVLNIKNQPNYIYGKHYKLVPGTKRNNRITWDPRQLDSGGIGLISQMPEGTEFEIQYARKVRT